MRQFQCVPTTYVSENKEHFFEVHTNQISFHCLCLLVLKYFDMAISIKIPHIVNICMTAKSPNSIS